MATETAPDREIATLRKDVEPPEVRASVWVRLGDAAVELGDHDEAFECCQKALDLKPDLPTYRRAAQLLWLTGNAAKAQVLMRKAISAGGPHAESTAWCRAELALMLFRSGALLPAEPLAERALAQAPGNPHVLAVLGRIRPARQDDPTAIDLCQRAIAIARTHDSLAALGDPYALSHQEKLAEIQCQRVVNFHNSAGVHQHDGVAHRHSHSHGNAPVGALLR